VRGVRGRRQRRGRNKHGERRPVCVCRQATTDNEECFASRYRGATGCKEAEAVAAEHGVPDESAVSEGPGFAGIRALGVNERGIREGDGICGHGQSRGSQAGDSDDVFGHAVGL
ncbi:hypothetical protein WICPIJ_009623, partial [Wickerhamomyces pijperi]